MKIIGVCGNSGSGKSTYCRKLSRERNALLIDVDKIVHEILTVERVRNRICRLVGNDNFVENGNINRKALGEILFTDKNLMSAYNKMMYKEIEFIIDRMIFAAQGGGVDVLIDWALLPMTKYYEQCDERHLIKKSLADRKKSILKRDGITEEYFDKREKNALKYDEKDFDKVIELEFKNKGLFAGTFDPFTVGHLDVVQQAKNDFDNIIVGVAVNPAKLRRFDKDSMQYAIKKSVEENKLESVDCIVYSGFTGAKALELDCYSLIRGVRGEEDLLFEKPMEDYNKQHFGLNTIYYYSPEHLKNVSSTRVKELMRANQSIENLVPKAVHKLVH